MVTVEPLCCVYETNRLYNNNKPIKDKNKLKATTHQALIKSC